LFKDEDERIFIFFVKGSAKKVDRVAFTFQTNGWKESYAPIVEVIQMQFFDVSSKE